MAPLPVIPDVFQGVLAYQSGEAHFANVMHFLAPSSNAGDVGSDLVAATQNAGATSRFQALVSSAATFLHWDVTPLDGISPTVRTSFASGVHGTGTTPCVPAQAAGIISLKTSSRGRSRRGRIYVACVPAGLLDADGARFGTTWAPDVATFFGNFLAELAALPQAAELVVVSRKLGDY